MALKPIGRYNHIDADKLAPLPPKGTIVKFKFGEPTLDPVTKTLRFAEAIKVPPISKCWCPDTSRWIDIGLVLDVNRDNGACTRPDKIWAEPNKNAGHLYVTIGSPAQDELYQYLMLSSSNGANVYRDPEAPIMYTYVDDARIAREELEARRTKRAAVNIVTGLEDGDGLSNAASLCGINADRDPETVRNDLEKLAELNPKMVIDSIKDVNASVKTELIKGLRLGSIVIDEAALQLKWKMGGQHPVLHLGSTDLDSVKNQFAAFVNTDERGLGVLSQLTTLNSSIEKVNEQKALQASRQVNVGGYPTKKPLFVQDQERLAAQADPQSSLGDVLAGSGDEMGSEDLSNKGTGGPADTAVETEIKTTGTRKRS